MEKVKKGIYTFDGEEWEDISKEAKEFIRKMICFDPGKYTIYLYLVKRYTAV
jgi:calcium-dependent protein kinase